LVPPAACTTSTAVREHALWLTTDVVAMFDYELGLISALNRRTADPEARKVLRQLACLVVERRDHATHLARFLDECAGKLEEAEELRDWDGLADLTRFTGQELAALINPLLDAIRDATRGDEAAVARRKLEPFFETFGAGIFEKRVAHDVGKRRAPTLVAEFERWRPAGQAAA
jgi:hypothetical protein